MLAKNLRIAEKKEFKKLFQRGASVKGDFISLKALKTKDGKIKFGFVVGQKISKKSVLRNKTRRRLRAVAYRFSREIKTGAEIVVMPSQDIIKKNFQEVLGEMGKVLRKARLI